MTSEGRQLPRWAEGLDESSTRRISNLVAQELRARELRFEFVEEGVEWVGPDGWPNLAELHELAQLCARLDPSGWSDVVSDRIGLLLGESGGPIVAGGREPQGAPPLDSTLESPNYEAPPGGIRSPFAQDSAGRPPPPLSPIGEAPPPWERGPPARSGARLRTIGWVLALGFAVVSLGLEVRAWVTESSKPGLYVSPLNEVLLEATPAGEAIVISASDGRTLSRTPLRFLIPKGPEFAVFVVAPGHVPVRQVLPDRGSVRVDLLPVSSAAPRCTFQLPMTNTWTYELAPSGRKSDFGDLEVVGTAVVRIRPHGNGAWLVQCPATGGVVKADLKNRVAPVAQVEVISPTGAQLHLGGRPLGPIPASWTEGRSFIMLGVAQVQSEFVGRWIPTSERIRIAMPTSNIDAPDLSIPGTAIEEPKPALLRYPRERRPGEPADNDRPF